MCEGHRDVGPLITGSTDDIKIKSKLEIIPMKLISLFTTDQHEKHGGEFVALERGGNRQVIASGNNYKKVVEAAKKLATSFLVISVPKKGSIHTH